jgi:hypothetical protein
MSTSPPAVHSTKRKRKAPRIVDSDDDFDSDEQQNITERQDISVPASKATPKKAAVTRKASKRKTVKSDVESVEQNTQETSDDEERPKKRERAKGRDTKDVINKDEDGERPTKRQKLPSIKKNLPLASSGVSGNGTPLNNDKSAPTASSTSGGPIQRKIVDGPISNDMDLRDPDAFAQLFKKVSGIIQLHFLSYISRLTPLNPRHLQSGTGKSDARYDLTSREKSAKQRAELLKQRAEYIAEKAENKVLRFTAHHRVKTNVYCS